MAGKPLVSSSPKKEGALSDAARRLAACMLETLPKVLMLARVCEKDSGAVSDAERRCSVCSWKTTQLQLKKRLDDSTWECVFGGLHVEVCVLMRTITHRCCLAMREPCEARTCAMTTERLDAGMCFWALRFGGGVA